MNLKLWKRKEPSRLPPDKIHMIRCRKHCYHRSSGVEWVPSPKHGREVTIGHYAPVKRCCVCGKEVVVKRKGRDYHV